MFKKIARRVLTDELKQLERQSEYASATEENLRDSRQELAHLKERYKTAADKISSLKRKIDDLEYQNAMLREYYDIDKEPSDEIKMKMRINDRIHQLELEVTRLESRLLAPQVAYTLSPLYPVYYTQYLCARF